MQSNMTTSTYLNNKLICLREEIYQRIIPVLYFVCTLPKPTSTTVTRVQEVPKVGLLEMFTVAELVHERTLTKQTHNHLLI